MIKNRLPHITANDFQLMYLFVRLYLVSLPRINMEKYKLTHLLKLIPR